MPAPAADPRWRDYVAIARPDYWFKNLFMLAGVAAAVFFEPELLVPRMLLRLLVATVATCLICSANYVLNEVLDSEYDRHHPVKCTRPLAAGRPRTGSESAIGGAPFALNPDITEASHVIENHAPRRNGGP